MKDPLDEQLTLVEIDCAATDLATRERQSTAAAVIEVDLALLRCEPVGGACARRLFEPARAQRRVLRTVGARGEALGGPGAGRVWIRDVVLELRPSPRDRSDRGLVRHRPGDRHSCKCPPRKSHGTGGHVGRALEFRADMDSRGSRVTEGGWY